MQKARTPTFARDYSSPPLPGSLSCRWTSGASRSVITLPCQSPHNAYLFPKLKLTRSLPFSIRHVRNASPTPWADIAHISTLQLDSGNFPPWFFHTCFATVDVLVTDAVRSAIFEALCKIRTENGEHALEPFIHSQILNGRAHFNAV